MNAKNKPHFATTLKNRPKYKDLQRIQHCGLFVYVVFGDELDNMVFIDTKDLSFCKYSTMVPFMQHAYIRPVYLTKNESNTILQYDDVTNYYYEHVYISPTPLDTQTRCIEPPTYTLTNGIKHTFYTENYREYDIFTVSKNDATYNIYNQESNIEPSLSRLKVTSDDISPFLYKLIIDHKYDMCFIDDLTDVERETVELDLKNNPCLQNYVTIDVEELTIYEHACYCIATDKQQQTIIQLENELG